MVSKTTAVRADKTANALAEAVMAHQRGNAAAAKRLYRKVLKAQPSHFKALRLSGTLAHQLGEVEEAIKLLNAAVRHAPADETGALEDLGLIHLQTGGQEKAENLLCRAVEIKPNSLTALSRLGSTLITCGRGSDAVKVLRRARDIDSEDPQIGYALAHALLESSEFDEAVRVADETLILRPEDPPTLVIKGVALYQLERLEEAERVLAQSVSLEAGDVNTWIHLGRTRLARENHAGAITAFKEAAALAPNLATVHSQLANALAATGSPEQAVAVCDAILERDPACAAVIFIKGLALRDAGRSETADALIGQDRLIVKHQIAVPARYENLEAFNRSLERMIRNHPSLARIHTNRATRHGIQTGSLMIDPPPEMRSFARVIDGRVRAALTQLREAGLGDHPWVRAAPKRWRINAWAVILSDQGHQLSHIHPEAWMSGCYYVALPADGMGPGHGQDGWIEFGAPTEQLYAKVAPPILRIEPKAGVMVTFPSYSFHRTIPFSSKGERICLPFDVFAVP
jgi:uncharacterized protein (TIGR02466 family)